MNSMSDEIQRLQKIHDDDGAEFRRMDTRIDELQAALYDAEKELEVWRRSRHVTDLSAWVSHAADLTRQCARLSSYREALEQVLIGVDNPDIATHEEALECVRKTASDALRGDSETEFVSLRNAAPGDNTMIAETIVGQAREIKELRSRLDEAEIDRKLFGEQAASLIAERDDLRSRLNAYRAEMCGLAVVMNRGSIRLDVVRSFAKRLAAAEGTKPIKFRNKDQAREWLKSLEDEWSAHCDQTLKESLSAREINSVDPT